MKPSDLLGVVIRVCGFAAIVWGLWHGMGAVTTIPSAVLNGQMPVGVATNWLASVAAVFGFGVVCFAWADWLVAVSYRRSVPTFACREVTGAWPRDLFGLIVRGFGVAVFLYGSWNLFFGLADALGLLKEGSAGEMRAYLVFGIPATIFGLAMVGGASVVVRFSFYLGERSGTEKGSVITFDTK